MTKYNQPTHEYFLCLACQFPFKRAIPADTLTTFDKLKCPNCHAVEAPLKDAAGNLVKNAEGLIQTSILKCEGYRQVNEWHKRYRIVNQKLPFRAHPNQHIRLSAKYLAEVWPGLSFLERSIVEVLLLYTGRDGTACISQSSLATYAMPGTRNSALDLKTIKHALDRMQTLMIEVFRESENGYATVPLLQITRTTPHRYRVNLP